ncbi:hypothetical protein CAV_0880 [Campylobacter avium LMG 24591]|uniref:Uncharacterized protein n=1 Tax=Campylobacter avium LMG 24591 TaxID=522484 RepID=A0A222MYC0_9BACT|nr:hypothetical protein [Campylobacter avium]ASQ30542.1 hypothetical protein CAV_0880 [Campylobacter avium LMG 24591]OYD79639.1 hypothetical protein CAV8706_0884 [Campylobacter avium]
MIKEDIATYRAMILLILSSIFAIIGYAIINIEKLTTNQTTIGIIVSFLLLVGLFIMLKIYLKARKILKDLE